MTTLRLFFLAGLAVWLTPLAVAQNARSFDVGSIPAGLLAGAHVVMREHQLSVEIASPEELEEHYHAVFTILDREGGGWAKITLPYDQFNAIRDLQCQLYDVLGLPGKKYGKKDFQDFSFLDDLTMAQNGRFLYLDLSGQALPFTLEVNYTRRSKSSLFCPDYAPQPDFNLAVEHSQCSVRVPAGQSLLYQSAHSPEPVVTTEGDSKKYSWEFRQLKAIPDEPYNLPIRKLAPVIWLNASDFNINGYTGSFTSWDGFARWNQQMLTALPPLSESTVQEIRQLTQGLSERERIRAVYRYLQNSTRYVSIQLGIGGWQPFDPNFVHTKKYGDCKALSWYTCALLKAAGVQAYYTLADAGDSPRDLDPAFPNMSFNHVIVTVPTSAGDTVFLECTSQTCPPGYMGSFTGNRNVLLIDGDRGRVIHLPAPPASQNLHTDSIRIELTSGGPEARVHWLAHYQDMAIEDDDFFRTALHADPTDWKKWVEKSFSIKGGKIESYDIQVDTATFGHAAGTVRMDATSAQLLNITAKRMYFQPNFFQPWTTVLVADSARISPVFRRFGHSYAADLSMPVPAGWSAETIPAAVEETTPFGVYRRSVSFDGGLLHYRRQITLEAGTFAPERYNEMAAFFRKMKKWDGENVVLVRKD